jgi:leader peptidase (prepilin peptidase) / N-methyltransferase
MDSLSITTTYILSILMGLVVGSFLNVVIVRLPKGQSIISPGSRCPHCRKSLSWWENIPLVSFIFLLGKCRHCEAPISLRYPVIEALCAVLFLAVRIHKGWSPQLFFREWPFVALLVSIAFIDLKHRIIPDALSLGGLILGISTCMADSGIGFKSAVFGAVLGFASFYLLAWAYIKRTGRSGLGGGDIKLLSMIGAFLGPSGVFATIFIGSITGSIVGTVWALSAGKKSIMKFSIPFGPFLILGAMYYYLLGDKLWFQFMIPM